MRIRKRSSVSGGGSINTMVAPKRTYEDLRTQRMEENKKRMQELNLNKLALTLKNSSEKPTPVKRTKPRTRMQEGDYVDIRRSSRNANRPAPVYREVTADSFARPRRTSYKKGFSSDRANVPEEARTDAIERAEALNSNLGDKFPSFVKPMLHSHVKCGFWLGLPVHFCKKNLPKRDENITLVDENGDEFETLYLAQKTGLSAGWRGFAIDHDLEDGDAVVFQLVERTKFKVYIVRLYDAEEE